MKRRELIEMVRGVIPEECGSEAEQCVADVFRVRWRLGGEERGIDCEDLSVAVEYALRNEGTIELVRMVDAEKIGELLGEAEGEFPERGRYRLKRLTNLGPCTKQEFVTLSEAVDRWRAHLHCDERYWLERCVRGEWVEVPLLKRVNGQWVRDERGGDR